MATKNQSRWPSSTSEYPPLFLLSSDLTCPCLRRRSAFLLRLMAYCSLFLLYNKLVAQVILDIYVLFLGEDKKRINENERHLSVPASPTEISVPKV